MKANKQQNGKADPRSKGLELRDLLSKPFQRMFAYKNIFARMLDLTPSQSYAYSDTEKLYQQIEQVVTYINEQKRQHENVQKMVSVSKKVSIKGDESDEYQQVSMKKGN